MRPAAEVRRSNTGVNRLSSIAAASLLSVFALQPAAHAEVVYLDSCFACALNSSPPAGDEWVIQGSFVHVGADMTSLGALTNNASYFTNNLNLTVRSALTNNKTFINSGNFMALSAAVNNNGTVLNSGSFTATSAFANNAGARFVSTGSIETYANIVNKGTFSSSGSLTLKSSGITNEVGGTFNNAGNLMALQSTINNKGAFRNQAGGLIKTSSVVNYGTVTNDAGGTMDTGGLFMNYSGSRLVNRGTITTGDGHFELAAGSAYDFTGGKLVVTNSLGRLYLSRDFTFGEARAGTVEIGYGGSLTNSANMQIAKGYSQLIAGRITNTSTGSITINANATLTTGDVLRNDGKLTNNGTLKLGEVLMGTLVNNGTLELTGSYVNGNVTGAGKLVQNENVYSTLRTNATFASAAINAGQVTIQGGAVSAGKVTVAAAATVRQTEGAVVTATSGLANNGNYVFTGNGGTVNGVFTNTGVVRVEADSSAVFHDRVVNKAQFVTEGGSSVEFQGDLVVGADGVITAADDTFTVAGSVLNSSLNGADWKTDDAKLILQGAGAHKLSLAGADRGASLSGYNSNFAWGSLTLGTGGTYALSDGNALAGGALYVGQLTLGGGLTQLGTINSAFNIYYNINAAGNEYLGGQTYAFGSGGGKLIGVGESLSKAASISPSAVPEPSSWALAVGGVLVTLWRRKARRAAAL